MNRREATLSLVGLSTATLMGASLPVKKQDKFVLSLNMSTLRGHNLGFQKELEIAAKAGYRSVEIWVNSLQDFLKKGNSLAAANRLITDLGLTVEGAIGFATWIVDDASVRNKGLEQLKFEMEQLAQIKCKRIASPPMGATEGAKLDLDRMAERYRAILEIGEQTQVIPHLELWGFSKNLSRTSELLYVATEASHPAAKVLMDVYHLHRGGSGLDSVKNVGQSLIEVFHVNDYPASPPREKLVDADRVYVGDGVAPIKSLLQTLVNSQQPVVLSFEVFNKSYYAQDPLAVAKTSLAKMQQAIALI